MTSSGCFYLLSLHHFSGSLKSDDLGELGLNGLFSYVEQANRYNNFHFGTILGAVKPV